LQIILGSRHFIQLSYRGNNHSGWQRQLNANSIQQSIEEAIEKVTRMKGIRIVGCGRTDTGVHAKRYFAHVDIDIPEGMDLRYRLNQVLAKEIAIQNIISVNEKAHARFDAEKRAYEYKIHFNKDPFLEADSAYMAKLPDMIKMNEGAKYLIGSQDFTSFAKVDNDANHHFCDLFEASWQGNECQMFFNIKANRFLRNMVRAVVGTLLEVGYGKRKPEDIKTLIDAKDRNLAGSSAPANGLALVDIEYPYKLL